MVIENTAHVDGLSRWAIKTGHLDGSHGTYKEWAPEHMTKQTWYKEWVWTVSHVGEVPVGLWWLNVRQIVPDVETAVWRPYRHRLIEQRPSKLVTRSLTQLMLSFVERKSSTFTRQTLQSRPVTVNMTLYTSTGGCRINKSIQPGLFCTTLYSPDNNHYNAANTLCLRKT